MAKDWGDMDYFQRRNKSREMGEMLGVDRRDYRPHNGGTDKGYVGNNYKDERDYGDDVQKALENDYDFREYLRYTGGDLPQTDEERYNLYSDMKKDHKQNRGGAFNSRSDLAGVSERAFDNYNDNMRSELEAQMEKIAGNSANQQTEDADLAAQQSNFQREQTDYSKYMRKPFEGDVYGSTNTPTAGGDHGENRTNSTGDSQRNSGASNFLEKYKLNLLDKLNLQAEIG